MFICCRYGGHNMSNRILGLDLGIGSIGWAVIDEDKHRVEDLGVRIFDSGEEGAKKAADRASQNRRVKRSIRRQKRRTKQRKLSLKQTLQDCGLISIDEIEQAYRTNGFNPDVFALRTNGLSGELKPIEIAAILINMANYRGYKEFYDDAADEKEGGVIKKAQSEIRSLYEEGKKNGCFETVGQMIYVHPKFRAEMDGRLIIRNRGKKDPQNNKKVTGYKYLIPREYLIDEARLLLFRQSQYHVCLTCDVIDAIVYKSIFRQRDFEDGPGPNKHICADRRNAMINASAGHQVYSGFEEMIGMCPFHAEERRGTKNSQLFDMYLIINTLSQFAFYKESVQISFPMALLEELRQTLFDLKGVMKYKEFCKFCQKYGIEVVAAEDSSAKKQGNFVSCKYIQFLTDDDIFPPIMQQAFQEESYFCSSALSFRMGVILTKFATPSRRKEELSKLFDTDTFKMLGYADKIKNRKMGSGAAVSNKYMEEAISSFTKGIKYGEFQANFVSEHQTNPISEKMLISKGKIPPIADKELIKNPVVYRTLNEARKMINAVRRQYHGIAQINIEVAKDVGQSFEQRSEVEKYQRENEKKNQANERELIAELNAKGYNVALSGKLLQKYSLWKSQDKRCMYSGEEIPFEYLLGNEVQVDHIIAQSIILDETLNNKVLVKTSENQKKGNLLPLEYMEEMNKEEFISRVSNLRRKQQIAEQKKRYLLLPKLDDDIILGFVDRNLNDTRYICKYITGFLKAAYGDLVKIEILKGSVTSRFRKRWLRRDSTHAYPSVYGYTEKGRDLHYYHHAIDAVVIANMKRPYIEIAQDYLKIEGMVRDSNYYAKQGASATANRIIQEIPVEIEKSIMKMKEHYHFAPEYTRMLLEKGCIPSICDNLRDEIETRIPLKIDFRHQQFLEGSKAYSDFCKLSIVAMDQLADSVSNAEEQDNDEEKEKESQNVLSHKNTISADLLETLNSLAIKAFPGLFHIDEEGIVTPEDGKNPVSLTDFIKKQKVRSMAEFVDGIAMCSVEEYTKKVAEFYEDEGFTKKLKLPYVSFKIDRRFRSEMTISDNPVKLVVTGCKNYQELEQLMKTELRCPYYVCFNKGINETGNFTIYDARRYYCAEVFLNALGMYEMRAIRYVDVRKQNGKLVLLKPLPQGCTHQIYLFKNEYIRVYDKKGKLKNNGFGAYRGVDNVNLGRAKMRLYSNVGLNGRDVIIGIAENTRKVEMSLLGHILGEIACGDQSLFTTVNG